MFQLFPWCVSPVFTCGCVSTHTPPPSDGSRLILGSGMRSVSDFDCSEASPHYVPSVFLSVGNLFTVLVSLEMEDEACSLSHDISVGPDNQTHPSPLQMTLLKLYWSSYMLAECKVKIVSVRMIFSRLLNTRATREPPRPPGVLDYAALTPA